MKSYLRIAKCPSTKKRSKGGKYQCMLRELSHLHQESHPRELSSRQHPSKHQCNQGALPTGVGLSREGPVCAL